MRALLTGSFAVCAAIAAALWFLIDPVLFSLHHPAFYSGDGMSHGFLVKTIIDTGWYPVHSPWVGMPFGADLFDYPFSDALNFLLIRLLALFSADWIVVANLFYLAGYFLAGVSAYIVLWRMGVTSALAVAGAFLFALLPYHWTRAAQLLLVSYAVVPLGVWLAYAAWRDTPARPDSARRYLWPASIAIVVGCGGAYYAFFSAFLVAVAGTGRALASRSIRKAIPAIAISSLIGFVVALNVAPSLLYRAENGPNPEVAARLPVESETYGLRLTQLVLPHAQHRISAMREAAQRYAASVHLPNANNPASLGAAGTAGLLILALIALRRLAGASDAPSSMLFLAVMALASILLGTIGGIGSLIAHWVSPIIRGYDRISIFVAFVSLAGFLTALQGWLARFAKSSPLPKFAVAAIALVLVGGLDQTPRTYNTQPDPSFASDRKFVRDAESNLPRGTMVWQLPYLPFPEARSVYRLEDYGPFRGYLNSDSLRWSYGAMKGRDADRWIHALATRPMDKQLELAAQSGFGAVYVDRRGFSDQGVAVETALRARLGEPIVQSPDRMLALYRLPVAGVTPAPLASVLGPIDTPVRFDVPVMSELVSTVTGISVREPWGRWTDGPLVTIVFSRELPLRFVLRIETAMALPTSVGVDLVARAGGVEHPFRVGAGGTTVELPFATSTPTNVLELVVPNPRSPRELGINADGRMLGIGLKAITILPQPAPR
jgi:phosphoglycerol transferase